MYKVEGVYCEGTHCSKRDTCSLHVKANVPNQIYEYIDWSTYGSGASWTDLNGDSHCEISHSCGDASGTYPRFSPLS